MVSWVYTSVCQYVYVCSDISERMMSPCNKEWGYFLSLLAEVTPTRVLACPLSIVHEVLMDAIQFPYFCVLVCSELYSFVCLHVFWPLLGFKCYLDYPLAFIYYCSSALSSDFAHCFGSWLDSVYLCRVYENYHTSILTSVSQSGMLHPTPNQTKLQVWDFIWGGGGSLDFEFHLK